jgi:Ca2+-binding RTX toxin-like protein
MSAVHRMASVTVSVAPLILAQAAPSQAASDPRLTCLGKAATIVGTPGPDILFGGRPEDVIVGLGGDDYITGITVCVGNDDIYRIPGVSTHLDGGDGDDRILCTRDPSRPFGAFDVLLGGAGNDRLADTPYIDRGDRIDPGHRCDEGRLPGRPDRLNIGPQPALRQRWQRHHRRLHPRPNGDSRGAGNDHFDTTGDNLGSSPYQPERVAGDASTDEGIFNRIDKVSSSTEWVSYVD